MSVKTKDTVSKTTNISKQFTYAKGDVSFSFSLLIEDDRQPRAFLKCLEEATKDVQELVDELKN